MALKIITPGRTARLTKRELETRQLRDRKCRHCGSRMVKVAEDFFGRQEKCRSCGWTHGIMTPQPATKLIGGK